ncbi:hypothetical protein M885DRAFT_535239 [Pelagophyceae sp. CCMP2097]|nr:hypothetical protein M885DRAFT_535239 [Pelagophyceae sp. CCMP2097]|mmetsp:Transcript_16513/g.55743  ORF Transcript_16513/g.55743 Transcript_16513/m.55743 type:complete len:381 (+) Transcript_16513:96-1238(+)
MLRLCLLFALGREGQGLSGGPKVSPGGLSRRTLGGLSIGGLGGALVGPAPVSAVPFPSRELFVPGPMAGDTVLVTGGNTGLGLETAKRLAAAGATVVLTARTRDKVDAALAAVVLAAPGSKPQGVVLDLASLESIKSFPARLPAGVAQGGIDVLVNNAGVMAIPERLETADGFERQIGINFLGHYALVGALLPYLRQKGAFRVVSVSSAAQDFATGDAIKKAIAADLEPEYSAWGNYGLSKAFNVAFSTELQRRFDAAGITASAVSLHPGLVQTDLARYLLGTTETATAPTAEAVAAMNPLQKLALQAVNLVVLPVAVGANTQVFLAAGGDTPTRNLAASGGLYFDDMRIAKPNAAAVDAQVAKDLWQKAEKLTGVKYAI